VARKYRLGRRQAGIDRTRARIVRAALSVLSSRAGIAAFTLDAVAARARVARMTVYHQFRSKAVLLEALLDELGARGQVSRVREAFAEADPAAALDTFIEVFGSFWAHDRLAMRRIHALAGTDRAVEKAVRARDARRRDALGRLIDRRLASLTRPPALSRDELLDLLQALTNFETFDALAGDARGVAGAVPIVQRLVRGAFG